MIFNLLLHQWVPNSINKLEEEVKLEEVEGWVIIRVSGWEAGTSHRRYCFCYFGSRCVGRGSGPYPTFDLW